MSSVEEGTEKGAETTGKAGEFFQQIDQTDDPAIQAIIEKAGVVEGRFVVKGYIQAMTVEWTIRRAGLGGDKYDADGVRSYGQFIPDRLPYFAVLDDVTPEIIEAKSTGPLVARVLQQLGRETGLTTYQLMVQHVDTIHALAEEKDKARREVRKAKSQAVEL